jgi:CheY-like chemotaxis protein
MIDDEERGAVLLVEADEPLAHVAIAYLERDGYAVAHVADLAAALDVARDAHVGATLRLIILDLDSLDAHDRERLGCRVAVADAAEIGSVRRPDALAEPLSPGVLSHTPRPALEALASHSLMLLSSDPCPPRWLRRPDVTILYKPFAMQELRQRIQRAVPLSRGPQ